MQAIVSTMLRYYRKSTLRTERHSKLKRTQDRFTLRTAVDQRGVQTFNPDGKTSGSIRNVANLRHHLYLNRV